MSTSQKFSVNQNGFAPILIVLIIAALVGGYFIYQNQLKSTPPPQQTTQPLPTPTSDPTANWETYVDAKSLYSIKFPDDQFINCGKDNIKLYVTNEGDCDKLIKNKPILAININPSIKNYGNTTNPTCLGLLDDIVGFPPEIDFIDNPTHKYSYIFNGNLPQCHTPSILNIKDDYYLIVNVNGTTYEIFYIQNEENYEVITKILSTFKFLP